jgi:3-hydroxyacyl-CoA dehydrogenase/3a,7a,12a-trihydroxy-5b-cholest-24-enoyl-CoA hydratase
MVDIKTEVERLNGHEFEPISFSYNERDVCLYALGVGAPANWLDQDELQFVYELSGWGFKVLPTFAVLYPSKMIEVFIRGSIGELHFNPMMLVHGEQYLEIKRTIPASAHITCYPKISAIYDKGSGMVIITDTVCQDENGLEIAFNQSSLFIRGMGGFGGDRGPSGEINIPPDRPPDATVEHSTLPQQALLYRLSGDINPLHADPTMSTIGGFNKPILHGLCTFGFAGRALLKTFCNNDPSKFKSIQVRFSRHVFPGETLITEMWQISNTRIIFRTKVAERAEYVLTQAAMETNHTE